MPVLADTSRLHRAGSAKGICRYQTWETSERQGASRQNACGCAQKVRNNSPHSSNGPKYLKFSGIDAASGGFSEIVPDRFGGPWRARNCNLPDARTEAIALHGGPRGASRRTTLWYGARAASRWEL